MFFWVLLILALRSKKCRLNSFLKRKKSTRSAPAEYPGSNLRRTYSSPNLTPSGSNGSFGNNYGNYGQSGNQFSNQFSNQFGNHRHSMNYGRNNPYQVKSLFWDLLFINLNLTNQFVNLIIFHKFRFSSQLPVYTTLFN